MYLFESLKYKVRRKFSIEVKKNGLADKNYIMKIN